MTSVRLLLVRLVIAALRGLSRLGVPGKAAQADELQRQYERAARLVWMARITRNWP